MELHKIYNPITATPFVQNESYVEIEPCRELRPYIKCFWGAKKPYKSTKTGVPTQSIVIPDTCMDIIFDISYTDNRITNCFCGMDEKAFTIYEDNEEEKIISTFAIRFYPWSTFLFAEDSMKNTKNTAIDLEYHFSGIKRKIEPLLFDVTNMEERILIVQKYLLEHIHLERMNPLLMNSILDIMKHKGNIEINKLSNNQHISNRQLERVFLENVSITPKKLSSLIRYQYLWNDILYKPNFQVLDAVFQYGYTDQAHLSHEFKRFHTMTIPEAKRYASQPVAFLQDRC